MLALCAAGRLYAVEEWVQAGKSLQVPREFKKMPLSIAVFTGFHSLIELLLRHERSQQAKNDVSGVVGGLIVRRGTRATSEGPDAR